MSEQRDIVDRLRDGCPGCKRMECKAADEIESLRAEIARLREDRRWVPVGERLPDRMQTVWVVSSLGAHAASLDSSGQWLDDEENPGKKITHWQPLPPVPEAKNP